ncbi:hypothetical protein TNCT_458771 [Trichonephila clavata]|uniref:Uncharacterized protein n=1 Tax=Trichonephila clavata TaxID=2740835 RepID=A0A8X6FY20_TRICU|nr:hypothetical protein TNCT_458771 [Trichonephila clavata]
MAEKAAATKELALEARKGKEAFDVENDSDLDFDGNCDKEIVVLKTPKNITSKGQNSQSMSEKKLNFDLPGKAPQKNNSFIAKKQLTPVANGKSTVQEFKGMKGNKIIQKKLSDEEIDDEDDSDIDMDDNSDDF